MDQKIILEIIQSVKPELWAAFIYGCIALLIMLIIKAVIEMQVAHFFFVLDKRF